MKKTLLAVTVFAGILSADAQITITQADIAPLYTVLQEARDTMPTVLPGSAGASQTWNFAALNNHLLDTLTFTLPQFTPYDTTFPNANMAIIRRSQGVDSYNYAILSANDMQIAGGAADPLGTGTNIALAYANPEMFLDFPTTYNTSYTDTAGGTTQFYYGIDPGIGFVIDSVRVHTRVLKNSDVDAWGSCTTPLGTYNVIRQNTMRTQYDTIDIYALGFWQDGFFMQEDSARTYTYWANSLGYPVVELTDDQNLGNITSATWTQSQPAQTNISDPVMSGSIRLYPNPASDLLFVDTEKNAAWLELYTSDGRLASRSELNGIHNSIGLENMSSGLYIFRVCDRAGNTIERGKINLAR
ncbi:MAG: hypothetical protein FD123_2486 [Bacteroidetes bacterium]|nr:MAG: hypothetical protein FD123_2486 [Bacteroidota bacterium]